MPEISSSVPDGVDPQLRVHLSTNETGYIVGSCHTFPGRMSVIIPADDHARCVSKSDITDCSDEGRYWIQGFLNGSVPSPPDDPAEETSWLARRASFLETGEWPH
jgi:hypothetical protein